MPKTPKHRAALVLTTGKPRPNGWSFRKARISASGAMLLKRIEAAHAHAAPAIPIRGTRMKLSARLSASATTTLNRFHMLRPPMSSTMSTGPIAVATSIATASSSSDDAPAAYWGLKTRSRSGANTASVK